MTLSINSFNLKTPLLGMPNVYNILAAYNCGVCFNILPKTIIKGIEALKSVPGRFERVDCGQPFQVIVDFAHSPDALQKLIETYRPLTKEKIVLVFGCPGDRDRAKRPIMGKIAVEFADKVIITTDDPHTEDPKKIIEEIGVGEKIVDRKEAIKKALILAKKGDTVLIAGRGHEKDPFDDRDVVRDFFLAVKFVA
ncbi:MAG: UDP-N-acetylmuramoyl-L-alanyl-D-glutamate--2,6-diaminopimelate ligase, partial [Candidatus Margulisbacteria bacterium]|nr:UDP-N-acetylmuramoyl-L-alanyl-D-glutamate--2,6-diaminopimelate ligase [Candidatus Margulisiibacteriota bacterium]